MLLLADLPHCQCTVEAALCAGWWSLWLTFLLLVVGRICSYCEKWPSLHTDRKLAMVTVKSLSDKFNVSITCGFIFTVSHYSQLLITWSCFQTCLNAWAFNLSNYTFAFPDIPLTTFQISLFYIVFFFGCNIFSFFYIYNYLRIIRFFK